MYVPVFRSYTSNNRHNNNMKHIKIINRFDRLRKSITIFLKSVKTLILVVTRMEFDVERVVNAYTDLVSKEIRNRGVKTTVNLLKSYHQQAIRIAVGHEFDPIPWRKTIKKTKIAKDLRPFLPYLQGDLMQKRFVLTITSMYRLLYLDVDKDLTSITSPGKESLLHEDFELFVKEQGVHFLGKGNQKPKINEMSMGHMTTKNGPNGPALRTVHEDSFAIFNGDQSLKNAIGSLLEMFSLNVYDAWCAIMDSLKDLGDDIPKDSIHSKISQISEGGGKTRTIAIIDYWSQNALMPIHDHVMSFLRSVKEDGTYNQERSFKSGKDLANKLGVCYSFDLSSATDRFPLTFQMVVMNYMFGEKVGSLWKTVISDRDFAFHGTKVRWKVGQPLGALSSWGVFALTHHLFIRWCAGDIHFRNYRVLGDDVMIFDSRVARTYAKKMEEIGVTINLSKSLSSEKSSVVCGEFAKRIFIGKHEISPIAPDLLLEAKSSIYSIPMFLEVLQERWEISLPGCELYAPELFSFLTKKGQSLLRIILSLSVDPEAPKRGYPWCTFNKSIEDIRKDINKLLIEKVINKVDLLMEQGSKVRNKKLSTQLIAPLKEKRGEPVSQLVLGWLRGGFHPISMLGIKIMGLLSDTQDLAFSNLKSLDKFQVVFTPDPMMNAYFYDRKTVRHATYGKLVLNYYFSLLKTSQ